MPAKQGLLRGSKFNMRHTTIIDSALPFVRKLKDSIAVKKISIGIIKRVAGNPNRNGAARQVKALVLSTAVRFSFRGGSSVQEFHVFGPDLDAIARLGHEWTDVG